ncbi:hypothetical protein B0I35DRAFT_442031, partial [Stachybotrys elegans]
MVLKDDDGAGAGAGAVAVVGRQTLASPGDAALLAKPMDALAAFEEAGDILGLLGSGKAATGNVKGVSGAVVEGHFGALGDFDDIFTRAVGVVDEVAGHVGEPAEAAVPTEEGFGVRHCHGGLSGNQLCGS